MDFAQELLFGEMPRFVGNPNQWCVFDEKTFDFFVEENEGEANCYARISHLSRSASPILDRVFLDLDGEVGEELTDTELVRRLRKSEEFRQSVLREVVEDARSVAKLAREESIPLVGVYSGKGIHLHLLFEKRDSPVRQLKSNTEWILNEADVSTFDRQVFGDVKRLCRVPNCRRYDETLEKPTDLYVVPLSAEEILSATPEKLVEWSREPRQIEKPAGSRPPFFERSEVEMESMVDPSSVEREPVGVTNDEIDENLEAWVEDLLQLPCLYQRVKTSNPSHDVRLASAIMMMNAGLEVSDVEEVFSRMGWADFDRSVTRKNLKSIKRRGYASFSCESLQAKGLCVFERGERDECRAYGYDGGDQFY